MNTTQTLISIDGMTCAHCVLTIRTVLLGLPGVRSVDVRLRDGTATVAHDGLATTAMTNALADAGFPSRVGASRRTPAAPGCCGA